MPAGHYDESTREISVRAVGELVTVDGIRDLVVATAKDGSAVRLRDIANVEDGWEEMRTRIRSNGDEAVSFEAVKQSGRNTMAIADAVKERLAALEKTFPAGMKAALILDTSAFIRENAHEVEVAIVFGGAMAILIILVFMLDLRSTIISAFALPTSVIATFFLMYVLGYTLNMMTLLGLSLAIGLLIDDAVVVRENIFKHLERGEPPREAALRGTEEIALSVLATTLTIVAVFVPVAFMSGIVGQFFRQFGLTVSAAVLISLFVAFTLDPMLSSRFSKTIDHSKPDAFAFIKRPFEWVFKAMDDVYRGLLGWALRHKLVVGALALGSLVGIGQIMGIMGSDFVNAEDRGQMVLDLELPAGTSLAETSKRSAEVEQELLADPLIKTVFVTLGPQGDVNKTSLRILALPKQERSIGLLAIKDKVRAVAAKIPGVKVSITDPPFVEGAGTQAAIMINCRGTSYETLAPYADKVGEVLKGIAGVADVQVRYTPGRPEMRVEIDRQRAADQGLAVAQVAMALRTAMEGEEAGKMRQGKDEVPIRVRLRGQDRAGAADLGRITLSSPKGMVALADVARLSRGEGPQVIEREARKRQIAVWATPNGRSLGDIVKDLLPRLEGDGGPRGRDLQLRRADQGHDRHQLVGRRRAAARGHLHLPGAGLAVRELHPPAHHHDDAAARHRGRHPRPLPHQELDGHGLDDRHHPADGPRHQERHPPRRPRHRPRARSRRAAPPGHPRGRAGAAPAHPHDLGRDGARHAAHGHLQRRRQRVPRAHGHRGHRRRDQLDPAVPGGDPGALPRHRERQGHARPLVLAAGRGGRPARRRLETTTWPIASTPGKRALEPDA